VNGTGYCSVKKHGFRVAKKYCFNVVIKVDTILPISTYADNEIKKIAKI